MHLSSDYIQPLTTWLIHHQNWALLIAFLISFGESLAIVGSIIPGSIAMTAVGILAGSGVMDIESTLIAAAIGAIVGDGVSFALGYVYSERLSFIWPFNRYPHWLSYGKDYFAKHGGKSVIIGRFFGPLRSIIPLIAGVLRMNGWHFLLANIVSGIAWSLVYVTPGILIGAASTELSTESAARLFIFILLLLGIIWLLTQAIKWLYFHSNNILQIQLVKLWIWSNQFKSVSSILKKLTPPHEKNHYSTASLILLFLCSTAITILIFTISLRTSWIGTIDNPCLLFLQSLRTQSFDDFFIAISLFISPLSLLSFALTILLAALFHRNWRLVGYCASLIFMTFITIWVLTRFIHIPKPNELLLYKVTPGFQPIYLSVATGLFCFLIAYANAYISSLSLIVLRIVLSSILFIAGFAQIYLGDIGFSSVLLAYTTGFSVFFGHWIYYRRTLITNSSHKQLSLIQISLSILILIILTVIGCAIQYKRLVHEHAPYVKQYVLTQGAWWNHGESLLPVYTTNRIGQRSGLFNIQFLGSIKTFQDNLSTIGWKKQPDSFFYSLLMRASGQNSAAELPLMAQLYQNRKPILIMTYSYGKGQASYILRLWRSNYHLQNYSHPILLGSIIYLDSNLVPRDKNIFTTILPALNNYQLNYISLPYNPKVKQHKLLMIKE